MNKALLLITVPLLSLSVKAQKVSNPAYDVLLQTLLAHSIDEISVQEAATMDDVIFLDSREKSEFELSHLPGALWLGYEEKNYNTLNTIEKGQKIILYCSVGYRSEKVGETLKEMGYTQIYNLYGGIFEWKNQGLEVVTPHCEPTDSVHAYNRAWGIWLDQGIKVY